MKSILLDTSAWLAANLPREAGYERTSARLRDEIAAGFAPVTTSLVIAEMHVFIARRAGIRAGQHFLQAAVDGGAVRVVYPDAELIRSAVKDWVIRFTDQRFSLCDAVSFEVMRREGITRALALDGHFATAGFELVT